MVARDQDSQDFILESLIAIATCFIHDRDNNMHAACLGAALHEQSWCSKF